MVKVERPIVPAPQFFEFTHPCLKAALDGENVAEHAIHESKNYRQGPTTDIVVHITEEYTNTIEKRKDKKRS